ncbi:hypothetical protein C6P85_00700 [Yersinia pestis]|nr:hypothetical protein C6P85_00700 [Yersinia pestis]PRH61925.1 hypothetical protein C6P90_00585 [Yersinia pestis]PRH63358.1 hypothetical protein C6P83_00700 [Yersinia pestis]PRH71747.1 hypothetical protein C6P89_00700 [Yersinia pestis]PRH74685.1 hypothetical protein C6P80_00695 [Yersinia pestis]
MAWGRYPLQHARLRAYGILLARLSPRSYCHLFYPAIYTQVTSSCMCVGCVQSPKSLTGISSLSLSRLLPSCTLKSIRYIATSHQH